MYQEIICFYRLLHTTKVIKLIRVASFEGLDAKKIRGIMLELSKS